MKKLLCLFLVLTLTLSVMVGCGKNNADIPETENDVVATDNSTQNEEIKDEEVPVSSDTTAKKDTTPKPDSKPADDVKPSDNESSDPYLILNASTNEESITYHLQNCPLLKGKEIQKVSWEMIKTLAFRHCSKCNPPKYEGYVE